MAGCSQSIPGAPTSFWEEAWDCKETLMHLLLDLFAIVYTKKIIHIYLYTGLAAPNINCENPRLLVLLLSPQTAAAFKVSLLAIYKLNLAYQLMDSEIFGVPGTWLGSWHTHVGLILQNFGLDVSQLHKESGIKENLPC